MIHNAVVLIDSGIDVNNSEVQKNVVGGKNLLDVDNVENYNDDNGHGTQCASIIKSLNSDVKLYCLKIVNRDGVTSSELLSNALECCLDIPISIISISISIIKEKNIAKMEQLFDELKKKGRFVLVSVTNGRETSYPAVMKNVIGIKGKWFKSNEDFLFREEPIQGIFNSSMQLTYGLNNEIAFFQGNSKACAVCAGILSRVSSTDYEQYLKKNGAFTQEKIKCIDRKVINSITPLEYELLKEVLSIFNNSFTDVNLEQLFYSSIIKSGYDYKKIIHVLDFMSKKYNITFDYMHIGILDVCYFYQIVQLIEKEIIRKE